jgi:hypothetical protein
MVERGTARVRVEAYASDQPNKQVMRELEALARR